MKIKERSSEAFSSHLEWVHSEYIVAKKAPVVKDNKVSPFFLIWVNMMRKCYDPTMLGFETEGAKGIDVAEEWHDPGVFIEWAESTAPKPKRPKKKYRY